MNPLRDKIDYFGKYTYKARTIISVRFKYNTFLFRNEGNDPLLGFHIPTSYHVLDLLVSAVRNRKL